DGFQFRNNLAIELPAIVECATEQGYLEKQFKGKQGSRQFRDPRPAAAQMFANEVEVTGEDGVLATQSPIDAPIFQGAKDSSRQLRQRKEFEHVLVAGQLASFNGASWSI